MQIDRHQYVPFAAIGGLGAFMEDKKYYAQKFGPHWDVVSWEGGELVCDRILLEENENARVALERAFG